MTDAAVELGPAPAGEHPRRRILRIAAWLVGILLVLGVLQLLGVDVWDWLENLWESVTAISIGYVILGCVLQGAQTVLTALGWYGILRYAYPGGVTFMAVLAAYAVGVALNNVVPANMGTFVTLLMYVAIVRGSTFPGVLAGYMVQKIFYLIVGTLIYLYLFSQVAGSFDFQFGNEWDALSNHPVLTLGIIAGSIFLIAIVMRVFWRWVKVMWARAKEGAAILGDFGAYVKLVLLPQMGGYVAKVGVIIVFLAAYGIPVSFGSVMSVLGSNQLANLLSLTPGGVGVNQAFNTFALDSYTDSTTATAYSVGQQLVTTAFNIGFAIILVCIVFGWSGGSTLVKTSYVGAKEKASEMKEERHTKKELAREEESRGRAGRAGICSVSAALLRTKPSSHLMARDDERRPGLADAAGRAAFFPARAAARAWRGPLEEAVDEVLSAPEIARVIDRALAGSLPEEIARSLVRNRVLERIAAELAASGELERLVTAALASPRTGELTDRVLASDETQRALRHVASSPELRDAVARQTTGLAEEVVGGVRASAARLDDRAERALRRPARTERPVYAGIATRAIALTTDAALTIVLFMSVVGMAALVSSLVGGLRPEWLVGALLASGWILVVATYFTLFWSSAGQTPGMRLMRIRVHGPGGAAPSLARSVVRLIGLVLAIVPLFLGFVPVLFTARRRGLPDFLAGTVVLYDA